MIPNLTSQYISYSMAVFSANEIRTFLSSSYLVNKNLGIFSTGSFLKYTTIFNDGGPVP